MIIPENYGQFTWTFEGVGLPYGATTTLGFFNPNSADAQVIADDGAFAFGTYLMPLLVGSMELTSCKVKLGPNDVGPEAISIASLNGSDQADAAPPNVAILVRKTTEMGGRKHRGRMFIPGLDEEDVTQDGTLSIPKRDAIQAALNDFNDYLSSVNTPFVILHSDLTTPTGGTALICDSRVATQRRRLRR